MAKRLLKYHRYHVDLTRRIRRMGTKKRTTAGIVLSLLAATLLPVLGHAQTAEQLRQLEQLTPARQETQELEATTHTK